RPPDPDLEGPQGAGALDRLLPRWPPAYQRRSRPHRQAVGRGRRPEARLDGSVSPLTTTVRTLRDPVALALLPEGFAGQAEQLCSVGLVVPRPLQRLEDVLLLELLAGRVQSVHQRRSLVRQGHPFAAKPARRLRRAAEIRARREPAEIPGLDLATAMTQRHGPFHRVFQFSDVAGKGIAQKHLLRPLREGLHPLARPYRKALQEVLGQDHDVLFALPQRRQIDRDYAQPIIEVFPESSGLHFFLEVPLSGA